MIMFLAELNGLDFWSTDIGNAYLESNTTEKIYIIGGKEFSCVGLEGHTLVVVKALYGLKSSGSRWWEVLADVLRQMGFIPSKDAFQGYAIQ
jgi:Reverse transcriptase (RNA-dependent DNA polymerase)